MPPPDPSLLADILAVENQPHADGLRDDILAVEGGHAPAPVQGSTVRPDQPQPGEDQITPYNPTVADLWNRSADPNASVGERFITQPLGFAARLTPVGDIASGAHQGSLDIASTLALGMGSPDAAQDFRNRAAQAEQEQAQVSQANPISSDWGARMLRGGTRGLVASAPGMVAGPAGMIATGMAEAGAGKYLERKELGQTDEDALYAALRSAGYNGLPMALMQRFGLGGTQQMLAEALNQGGIPALKQTIQHSIEQAGIMLPTTAAELTDTAATTDQHLTTGDVAQALGESAVQGAMGPLLIHGAQHVGELWNHPQAAPPALSDARASELRAALADLQNRQPAPAEVQTPENRPPLPLPVRQEPVSAPPEPMAQPPAEAAKAPEAAPGTTFTTERGGSVYTVGENGITQRNKGASGGIHEGDVGVKEPSKRTVYVSPEWAEVLGRIYAQGSPEAWSKMEMQGDQIIYSEGGTAPGRKSYLGAVPYTTEPAVGLHPVEFMDKSQHIGSKITAVNPPASPQQQHDSGAKPAVENAPVENAFPAAAVTMAKDRVASVNSSPEGITVELGHRQGNDVQHSNAFSIKARNKKHANAIAEAWKNGDADALDALVGEGQATPRAYDPRQHAAPNAWASMPFKDRVARLESKGADRETAAFLVGKSWNELPEKVREAFPEIQSLAAPAEPPVTPAKPKLPRRPRLQPKEQTNANPPAPQEEGRSAPVEGRPAGEAPASAAARPHEGPGRPDVGPAGGASERTPSEPGRGAGGERRNVPMPEVRVPGADGAVREPGAAVPAERPAGERAAEPGRQLPGAVEEPPKPKGAKRRGKAQAEPKPAEPAPEPKPATTPVVEPTKPVVEPAKPTLPERPKLQPKDESYEANKAVAEATKAHIKDRQEYWARQTWDFEQKMMAAKKNLDKMRRGTKDFKELQHGYQVMQGDLSRLTDQKVREMRLLDDSLNLAESKMVASTPGMAEIPRLRAEVNVAAAPKNGKDFNDTVRESRAKRDELEAAIKKHVLGLGLREAEAKKVAYDEAFTNPPSMADYPNLWEMRLKNRSKNALEEVARKIGASQMDKGSIEENYKLIDERQAEIDKKEAAKKAEREKIHAAQMAEWAKTPIEPLEGVNLKPATIVPTRESIAVGDLGPSWWTDGKLLIDTDAMKGAGSVKNRMLEGLEEFKKSGRTPVNAKAAMGAWEDKPEAKVLGSDPLGFHGGKARIPLAWVESEGKAHAFDSQRLAALMKTHPDKLVLGRGLMAIKKQKVVGLVMPITMPDGPRPAEMIRARMGNPPPPTEAVERLRTGKPAPSVTEPTQETLFSATGKGEPAVPGAKKPRNTFGETPPKEREPVQVPEEKAPKLPPTAPAAASALGNVTESLKRIFAPQTLSEKARTVGNVLREHGAELARRGDQADEALKETRRLFDKMPENDRWNLIDSIETGKKLADPAHQKIADIFRAMLDEKRGEVQALGTGKLAHFIEDYFPHIWKDPEAASAAFRDAAAKRPLQGNKAFLKQRSIPTIAEGRELGLEPVSSNPVDLALLKMREMDKYILGQRLMQDLKRRGIVKFVGATKRAEDVAPGYSKINDSIAQVYGPPTITITEHVDKAVMDGLQQALDNLGIKHVREASTGRGNLGYSKQTKSEIHTKGGTELGVVAHEISHQLDAKFDLGKIINDPALTQETNDLAELRGENADYFKKPEERTAGVLETYVQAKERMQEVAPKTTAALEKFLGDHPETRHLLDLKPSVEYQKQTYEKAHGGLLKFGEYMAPDHVAQVMNNYLSPGLRGNAIFDAYNTVANSMNQFQLGLSAFHLGFTSLDAATSRLAVGIEHAVALHPIEAAKAILTTPLAPFTNAIQGDKILREWYKPGSQGEEIGRIVDGLQAAGGRARMDSFYQTNITKKMLEQWQQGPVGKMLAAMKLPFAAMEQASRPIMEYVVPRQKMGVFADMARKEIAALPEGYTRDQLREAMGRAWDSVDNRLGQLVYDNLFWKKAAKDLSMASVRSLGWNLGTLRELGGGAVDAMAAGNKLIHGQRGEFTHRMAYLLAMPALTGIIGGMIHYAYNGTAPQDLKDWFFPRTGEKDAQGRDVRLALPSYMKDVYHYVHDPVQTLKGKIHPAITAVLDMLSNQDYYGQEIRHSDDPLVKQVWDSAKHLASSWEPFTFKNLQQAHAGHQAAGEQAATFVGLTTAPKWVSMSDAEQLADKLSKAKMKGAPMPDADLQAKKNDVTVRLRDPDKAVQAKAQVDLAAMQKAGEITSSQAHLLLKRSGKDFLQNDIDRLDAREAVRVFKQATPQEAGEIYAAVGQKIARSQMAPQEKANLLHAFQAEADAKKAKANIPLKKR